MPDPPVRADGRCAECGVPRKLAGLAAVYRREAERDPFCSAPCARAWHGHPLAETPKERYRRLGMEHGTEAAYIAHGCRCDACKQAAAEARRRRRA